MPPDRTILDCGHVGQLAGICQYQGCAAELCNDCLVSCATCDKNLCPDHQVWLDGNQRVFCADDSRAHVKKKAVRTLIRRIR